jgi:actin-related protein 6
MSGPNAIPQPETEEEEVKATGGDENVVNMGNERFSVPEVVLDPRDIGKCTAPRLGRLSYPLTPFVVFAGLRQAGLVETVAEVIGSMDESIRGMLWSNIGLFGGLACTEGFGERL